MFLILKTLINFVNDGTNEELSQNDGPSIKYLVSAKMFNVYFYVYPVSI